MDYKGPEVDLVTCLRFSNHGNTPRLNFEDSFPISSNLDLHTLYIIIVTYLPFQFSRLANYHKDSKPLLKIFLEIATHNV